MANSTTADATVLGCGLMGSALAKALARAGKRVVVWNRTPAKAQALVGAGISAAAVLDEATLAAPTVMVCFTTYDDVKSTLAGAQLAAGTTLVNVTMGSPDEAVELGKWAADKGLGYLDGAILSYPADIDASAGQVAFAGTTELWTRHADLLTTLAGEVVHISDDISNANVVYVGVGAFYGSAVVALVESVSYLAAQGISPESVISAMQAVISLLDHQTEETVRAIEAGSFETDQATIAGWAEGARAAMKSARSRGHAARMISAASHTFDAAEAAGLGELGSAALHKISTSI